MGIARLKRHSRIFSIVLLASACMVLFFWYLVYASSWKSVVVVQDGQPMMVRTRSANVGDVLKQAGVKLGAHDRLSQPTAAAIREGDRIEVEHAIPVQLTADGKTASVYTIGRTVEDALADLNVSMGQDDRVEPAPDEALAAGDRIRVVRVSKKIVNEEVPIPYEVVQKEDPKLLKGKTKVVQQGKEGMAVQTVEKVYEDGVLVSETQIGKTTSDGSVDQIVAVGTRKPVTILSASSPDIQDMTVDGRTFGVKRILTDVILTEYDAGPGSTGKSKGDPQYGITYTGTRVKEGRTVAVDPKVIPLNWWVYIEGVGFRHTEDIGSGVKGKWIDIYVDSAQQADRFGLKRGATVYIIGPDFPG